MFKKRTQEDAPNRRRTQIDAKSNKVFSYYANRNPYEGARNTGRQDKETTATSKRAGQSKKTGQLLIVGLSLVALLIIAAYNATLTSELSVHVNGKPEDRLLLRPVQEYQSAAQNILAENASNKTKITIDTDSITNSLLKDHPELSTAVVALPLVGRTATLELTPTPVAARLIASNGQGYVLGSDGRAISTDIDAASVSSPIVTDQSGLAITVGSQVLPRDDMRFIVRLQHQFTGQNQKIESFVLPAAGRQLHVKLVGVPYYIKFSFESDVLQQVGAYQSVRKKLDREGVMPAQYIDVRVGDRAYYK